MLKYDNSVSSSIDGKPIYGAQVTVLDEQGNPAVLYSDESGTTLLSQPVLTDQAGYFAFYIGDGRYNIEVMTGSVLISRTNITMVDTLTLKSRALLVPVNEDAATLPPAGDRAGMLLGFDQATGAPTALAANSFAGPPGAADNTYPDKPSLAASDTSRIVASLRQTPTQPGARYYWTEGNYTGRTDAIVSTFGGGTPISQGAWLPQPASGVAYQGRSLDEKVAEVELSINDKQGYPDMIVATNAALAAIGTTAPTRLVVPRGAWTIGGTVDWSNYKNVAFVFRTGAIINQGANTVTLPDRPTLEPGARFAGTGAVIIRNKDEQPLATPPGGYVRTGNDGRGLRAAYNITKGTNNLAWGTDALASATTARSNIAIGNEALKSLTGSTDASSAYGTFMGIADGNISVGDSTLRDCTTGYENVGVGMFNMQRLTTGRWNVCLGVQNLILNTTGSCNIAIGPYAAVTYPGNNSVCVGFSVMENHDGGGSNTGVGYVALAGSRSTARTTAVGSQAAEKLEDGTACVIVGDRALATAIHGDGTVAIGADVLSSMVNDTNANNTGVGRNALLALTVGSGNTAIGAGALNASGSLVNSTGIGLSAQVTGNSQNQIGGSGTTTYTYGAVQDRSDSRDKADIRDTTLGLAFIKALRAVDFRWDMRDDYRPAEPVPTAGEPPVRGEDTAAYDAAVAADRQARAEWMEACRLGNLSHDGSKKRNRFHHGVIAQEVKALIDSGTIEDFGGFQDHSVNGGDDVMSIGYEELIAPLIKAVQELSARLEALEAK